MSLCRHAAFALLVPVVAALLSAPAAASVCDAPEEGLATGPLPLGFGPGALGTPRRACPRTEVAVGAVGGAIVEPESFYGNLSGAAVVDGSFALSPRLEVFGSLEPVLYRTVISSFSASHLGVGHSALGATFVVLDEGPLVVGVTSRAVLPTAFGYYKNAFPLGLESGLTLAFQPVDFLRLYGQASGLGTVMLTAGDPNPRAGLLAAGGAELRFGEWAALVGEVRGLGLYDADLDSLSLGLGLRARVWAGLGAEAGVLVPIAGRERSLGIGTLRVSYRF